MDLFEPFVGELERLANAALAGDDYVLAEVAFDPLLNGAVGVELRRRVPLPQRQAIGAFFTGASLRVRALTCLVDEFSSTERVWDPACGAGDLLLSYAARLPITLDLNETIRRWGTQLFGSDLQPLFIRAARARLVLAAYDRGARINGTELMELTTTFPGLRCEDSLTKDTQFEFEHIVLNPPYVRILAFSRCGWASGKVSAAAVFVAECLTRASRGTHVVAILPDVLRTGSRYRKWRDLVVSSSKIRRVEVVGAFDPQADVDVFVLDAVVGERATLLPVQYTVWNPHVLQNHPTIGDFFDVSVGPVVPHRDPEVGPVRPFLHAKNSTPWGTVETVEETRQWNGKVVAPPFLVVRRTSSPNDRHRATGTLVYGDEAVAVENHLIVLTPKGDNKVEACRSALTLLQWPSTTAWLNERIRCRHLTVESVRQIPIPL
jgi:hypothetical protein